MIGIIMDNIRIKPHFSTIVHDPDIVELRQGVWNSVSHLLQDENKEGILAKVILSLNKQLTPNDIAKKVGINRSQVESILDYLQQLGVLQSKAESFIDYYVDNIASTLRQAGKFKYQISMPVVLLGDPYLCKQISEQLGSLLEIEMTDVSALWSIIQNAGDDWLFDALEQQRFVEQFQAWQGKFIIFLSKHINPILATRLNRIAYAINIPWLHLAIDGPFILVGPTFNGSSGPCYDCFETRVSMNLRESASYQKYKNALALDQVYYQEDNPLLGVTANLLVSHAVLEILNYLTTQRTFTINKILTIFLPTMEFVYHEILRLSSCRTCGSVSHRDDTQLYFDFQRLIDEVAQ
jgi:thiazole/oxazole-forming peptide maturase SagC family component